MGKKKYKDRFEINKRIKELEEQIPNIRVRRNTGELTDRDFHTLDNDCRKQIRELRRELENYK